MSGPSIYDELSVSLFKDPHGEAFDSLFMEAMSGLPDTLRPVMAVLSKIEEWVSIAALEKQCADLVALHLALNLLAQHRLLRFSTGGALPIATLTPTSSEFVPDLRPFRTLSDLRLSRFAYMRVGDGGFVLETPLRSARIELKSAEAFAVLESLTTAHDKVVGPRHFSFLQLLRMCGVLFEIGGIDDEDSDVALRQWEFHDLLFHTRSRLGFHDYPMGGTYRFHGALSPLPAVRPKRAGTAIALYKPTEAELVGGPPVGLVVETRRSMRQYGPSSMSVEQLGEFLYRSCRVRAVHSTEYGELSNRPYPNGGASYEFEIYATVDACRGLDRGFYHYDPLQHALEPISSVTPEIESLLADAFRSSGQQCRPQVLLSIAARFQRVSWKYSGIAYAAQLKNVGALYSVMYIVAMATGLAPCGLGLGDSARFCRIAKTSPFVETSIGEFMLGAQA